MVHLIKLSVGIRDVEHLRGVQAARLAAEPPLRHRTRQWPRHPDILEGGSIYWVIAGQVQCRQAILDIQPDQRPDGSAGTALILDPALVLVAPRPVRAFQGWRYLKREEAPAESRPGAGVDHGPAAGAHPRPACSLPPLTAL